MKPKPHRELYPVAVDGCLLPFARADRVRQFGWAVFGVLAWTVFCVWQWLVGGHLWGPTTGWWWVVLWGLVWASGLWLGLKPNKSARNRMGDHYFSQIDDDAFRLLDQVVRDPASHPDIRRADLTRAWTALVYATDEVGAGVGKAPETSAAFAKLKQARRDVDTALGLDPDRGSTPTPQDRL